MWNFNQQSGVSWISYKHALRLITQLPLQVHASCLFFFGSRYQDILYSSVWGSHVTPITLSSFVYQLWFSPLLPHHVHVCLSSSLCNVDNSLWSPIPSIVTSCGPQRRHWLSKGGWSLTPTLCWWKGPLQSCLLSIPCLQINGVLLEPYLWAFQFKSTACRLTILAVHQLSYRAF